ncbi:sulfurtransferase complex subunit TusB [Hafnia psychrotolerans]|jgi:tRNA 2-thiouridine synthesizing protein B|uniref:Protein TusB n=1 Tax=Hafnia psychrotolerans TaxID=1477018 RepID=A0ABQ1GWA6_9GAMM|nr:sulfurtransferase complex subunit TusB [Hafnia psychrotolerans]GGA51581.1 protein TusB [Hafnia psychrotolerans]
MLFTLANSPQSCDLTAFLRLVGPQDALLLVQDGVLAAVKNSEASKCLTAWGLPVYVLSEDLAARGLIGQILHSTTLIDYTGFVALTEKHPQHIAWR